MSAVSLQRAVAAFLLTVASGWAQQPSAAPNAAAPPVQTDPARGAHLDLARPANPSLPTLFLVGDSTVRNGRGDGANNQMGWGEPLAAFFDPARINVVNRAIGGRSSRTYQTEGHWDEVLSMLKPGDVVLIQFGHNDGGVPDEPTRARASLPGIGDQTLEIENPVSRRHETVHTFGWYMARYVDDAHAKGATPILCSLVPRKIWSDGRIVRDSTYAVWTREVAQAHKAAFLDLNNIIADRYDAMGAAAVEPLFGDPHTHTTPAGAELNAESVIAGLKAIPHNQVAQCFSAKAAEVPAYEPGWQRKAGSPGAR